MATARAQALSGVGVHVRQTRGGRSEGTEELPPRIYTRDDDEYPMTWVRRVLKRALWTPYNYWLMAGFVVVLDAALTLIITMAVRYTEIDFTTYMQQVQLFIRGERRYDRLVGDSGPCVYPALHIYIFTALSYISSAGKNLMPVQVIYGVLYIVTEVAAMAMYKAAGIPPIALPLLAASKRLHSIYVLRLFNDCWAVFFMYLGIWAMCRGAWRGASILYSLALGVKMNILLYAPAMAAIYLRALGLQRSVVEALRVLFIQALLAMPFLLRDPRAYFSSAFDLSREFLYKWTVNWRFISEPTFLSKSFATCLLAAHTLIVLAFFLFRWTAIGKQGFNWIWVQGQLRSSSKAATQDLPSKRFIVTALATSNLVGITFARSLHYQFYSWYAHQIPMMIYLAALPRFVKIAIPICIEMAWNTFPSTDASSQTLLVAHLVLLSGLWAAHADDAGQDRQRTAGDDAALKKLLNQYDIPSARE